MSGSTFPLRYTRFRLTCACQDPAVVEPCLFRPDSEQKEDVHGEHLPVVASPIFSFTSDTSFDPKAIFVAVWSELLKFFVGQLEVTFGFTQVKSDLQRFEYLLTGEVLGGGSMRHLFAICWGAFFDVGCDCGSIVANKHVDSEYTGLFNTSVVYHDFPEAIATQALVQTNSILELHVFQKEHGLDWQMLYDPSNISKSRADAVLSALKTILSYNTHSLVNRMNMFNEEQRRVFDRRLRDTPPPSKHFLHELIERHATTSSGSEAVCGWDRSFTYDQMKEHADRLAHQLRTMGIGQSSIVPILSVKSAWVPVIIVGILKTGAAFLVMEPSQPHERLASIISRVDAKVVICSACPAPVENLVLSKIRHLVRIADVPGLSEVPADVESLVLADNAQPAYVIFTSGSTGVPKGVIIDHSAITSSTLAHGKALSMCSQTRMVQFAGHSFDACVLEFLTTLVHGGTVCIPSEEERLDSISSAMETMQVNTSFMTPTMARLLNPDDVPYLMNLFLGGEPLQADNISRWAPRVNLFNVYGPAEASVLSSVNKLTIDSNPKHIGPPVGCSAWIVHPDDYNRLAPDGTCGELVLMGPIVGLGYLHNPVETAKHFIEQPDWFHDARFHDQENQHRLYRTGDIACIKSDGSIMIDGRRNHQIKLHGRRMELGEIEFNLRQVLPKGSDVIVDIIVPGGDEEKKQLAAFIVLPQKEGQDGSGGPVDKSLLRILPKLRADLLVRIPSYMCPSVFIPIVFMPQTTSNKADRIALRELGSAKTVHELAAYNGIERTHRKPTTEVEVKMRALWGEILNLEAAEIGIDDSFFHLGGDSIKAILLVAAARKAGYLISSQTIFANPQLSALALTVQEVSDTGSASIEPFSIVKTPEANRIALTKTKEAGLADENIEDYYPSTAEQDRMFRQTLVNQDSHIILLPYSLGPEINVEKFRQAWDLLVAVSPIFRTRLVSLSDSTSLQVVMKDEIQWQDLEGSAENAKPLKVASGTPLASWGISKSKDESDGVFVFAIHHALLDGWSFGLFWKAIFYAYEFSRSPPIPASFNALIKYYESRDQEVTDCFWRSELKGAHASTLITMPSESYTPFQTKRKEIKVVLPTLSNSNITMSTILQVAYAMTLSSFEDSNDIVFRTTGTGRNQPVADLQEIIGPVLTSFPFRIQLDLNESLIELLERVQRHGIEVNQYEYCGVEQIKKLADNSNGIVCDSNSPYLIVHGDIPEKELAGMVKLPSKWQPSQTPLAVCCILKPDGMKIATGFDERMIGETKVDELLEKLEYATRTILSSLIADGNMDLGEAFNLANQLSKLHVSLRPVISK